MLLIFKTATEQWWAAAFLISDNLLTGYEQLSH